MKAEIKSITSYDIDDLENYQPIDPLCFSITLQFEIGVKEQKGGDIFNLEVCTPEWLMKFKLNQNASVFGRGLLIVQAYNFEEIKKKISKYCDSCVGDTWDIIAFKLSLISFWEFESYH